MLWTPEQQLAVLMRLPWTLSVERNEEDGYLVARVRELPSVVATGEDEELLGRDLWESLKASLACYLEFGDPIPLPRGASLPWEAGVTPPRQPGRLVVAALHGTAWELGQPQAMLTTTV